MTDRSGQPPQRPTPKHDSHACRLSGFFRHPAQAANGRALTAHLAEKPFPRQAVTQ